MKSPRIISWPVSNRPDARMVDEVVAALRRGALVILPTDTVYGVAADPGTPGTPGAPGAEERLCRVKRRPDNKPIALLAADGRQVEAYGAQLGVIGRALADRYWPGALTMVLKTGNTWEGFRIPNHPVTLAILKAMGGVLRVTSANMSGEVPALTAAAAVAALGSAVELAVDAGPAPGGVPSTVVKIGLGRCDILREGAIPSAEIAEIVASLRNFNLGRRGAMRRDRRRIPIPADRRRDRDTSHMQ
ncbi:MAG: L-threonylcarbamoyladenylate synthase [Kiritimatiellota bacterium]|nr:L-threonylcarbamoyladenylate synthase [Kiritimatiellota bacterium]